MHAKKNEDNNPLLLLCLNGGSKGETISLNTFSRYYDDLLSFNYNFQISNSINETFTINGLTTNIQAKYPDILDFSSNNVLNFSIFGFFGNYLGDILSLNPKEANLKCEANWGIYQCIVPKSHFKGEKNGYYYLHYNNSLGGKSIFYEVTPFKVILSGNVISSKINRVVFALFLLLLL